MNEDSQRNHFDHSMFLQRMIEFKENKFIPNWIWWHNFTSFMLLLVVREKNQIELSFHFNTKLKWMCFRITISISILKYKNRYNVFNKNDRYIKWKFFSTFQLAVWENIQFVFSNENKEFGLWYQFPSSVWPLDANGIMPYAINEKK